MGDPLHDRDSAEAVLRQVYGAAVPYLASLADRPVHDPATEPLLAELSDLADGGRLPEKGVGSVAALERLLRIGTTVATHSAGPRFFHFVVGGATPAALAADWTTALLDQNAVSWTASPLATEVETIALRWLRELFGLPESYGGVLVTSATFANFTSLGVATHWWAEQHDVDVAADGLTGLPRMPVLSGGYLHASSRKALQMLGHGRDTVEVYARDRVGRVDLPAIERRLAELAGPAVLIANAGEVNAGHFDPIDTLADIAERYGAWLHVDGAFGLFAALSPRTADLVRGVERADSIACDAHKWLNVPYESGFAFVREPSRLPAAFGMPGAAYLPGPGSPLWSAEVGGSTGSRPIRPVRSSRRCRPGRWTTPRTVRSRPGGPGRCRSGRPWRRTGATATGRWWSGSSTSPSGSPGWSTRHRTWNGSPRYRSASSVSGPVRRTCPPVNWTISTAGSVRRCSRTGGSSPEPPSTTAGSPSVPRS